MSDHGPCAPEGEASYGDWMGVSAFIPPTKSLKSSRHGWPMSVESSLM
jgi:hypothetical protein